MLEKAFNFNQYAIDVISYYFNLYVDMFIAPASEDKAQIGVSSNVALW